MSLYASLSPLAHLPSAVNEVAKATTSDTQVAATLEIEAVSQNLFKLDTRALSQQLKYDPERAVHKAMQITGKNSEEIYAILGRFFNMNQTADKIPEAFYTLIIKHFPLEILLDPLHRLNVALFMQSQKIFRNIAMALHEFQARHPEGGLEHLIAYLEEKQVFVQSGASNKELFYKEIFSVYQNLGERKQTATGRALFENCFAHRIYTLKNALVAINEPRRLLKEGPLDHLPPIGRDFFAESIRLHYQHLNECTDLPSEDEFHVRVRTLCSSSTPLLRKILASIKAGEEYVNKEPPDVFNSFSLNSAFHTSPICCTLLQAIMRYFGCRADMYVRMDLDPKITDSFAHVLLIATDPLTQRQIVVDPTYKQFLGSIGNPNDESLNTDILVCPLDQIDLRIQNFVQLCEEEKERPRSEIDEHPLRDFSNKAIGALFKQVWGLEGYDLVTKNELADALFAPPSNAMDRDHASVRKMLDSVGLDNRIPYESFRAKSAAIRAKYAGPGPDRLSLLGDLQYLTDSYLMEFVNPLGLDRRPIDARLLTPKVVGYAMALREKVNPSHARGKIALYGCSGSDLCMPMLAFNAEHLYLIDHTPFNVATMRILIQGTDLRLPGVPTSSELTAIATSYMMFKLTSCGGSYARGYLKDLETKFFIELNALGVDLSKVEIKESPEFNGVTLSFAWIYPGQKEARTYKVTYVCAKLDFPENYPPGLQQLLENQRVDYYYQKAAHFLPAAYGQYLPRIASGIRNGGYLLTSDSDQHAQTYPPTPVLAAHGMTVIEEDSLLLKRYRALFKGRIGQIWINDTIVKREDRFVIPNEEYWTFTTIRKKVS